MHFVLLSLGKIKDLIFLYHHISVVLPTVLLGSGVVV